MKTVFAVLLMLLWSFNALAMTTFDMSNHVEVPLEDCIAVSHQGVLLDKHEMDRGDSVRISFHWLVGSGIYSLYSEDIGVDVVAHCVLTPAK